MASWLSLTPAELAELGQAGVTRDDSGVLRGEDGGEVGAGLALMLLKARHPETGRYVAEPERPAAYAGPADFGMPEPVRISGPDQFRRGYLTGGHQSERPYDRMGAMPKAHPAEPEDFARGPLAAGHQADPPGSDRSGAEGMPAGTPARDVLASAAGQLARNYAAACHEHIATSVVPASEPAPSRYVMPADLQAECVPGPPHPNPSSLTARAPGETR